MTNPNRKHLAAGTRVVSNVTHRYGVVTFRWNNGVVEVKWDGTPKRERVAERWLTRDNRPH